MSNDDPLPFPEDPSEAVLFMLQIQGGLIAEAALAVKIGELLCAAKYGEQELARQHPLFAIDKETYWRVEGNWNRDGKIPGKGHFYVSIAKFNCRVIDFGCWYRYGLEGDAAVRDLLARSEPQTEKE